MKPVVLGAGAVVIAGLGYAFWPQPVPVAPVEVTSDIGPPMAEVTVPATFSADAEIGKRAYAAKCTACHAPNAVGQVGVAPPLVHIIYEPNHHGDESFQRAASLGVRAHHWPFGDMPPVEGITRAEVGSIIAYIRELQLANGIK